MEERGLRHGRSLRAPGELEILVGGHGALGETQGRGLVAGLVQSDLMERALDVAKSESRIELHLDRHGVDLAGLGRIEHRRGDAVAVRYRIDGPLLDAV